MSLTAIILIIFAVSLVVISAATYFESKGMEAAKWAVLLLLIAGALLIGQMLKGTWT